jgi:DNA sulfur modification protein DndB
MYQPMNDINEETFTGKLIAGKRIAGEVRKRLSPYTFETVPSPRQAEYEDDGWVVDRKLRRSVVMRRLKTRDVLFEDRVWAAMAKLNFPLLNKSRNFRFKSEPTGNGRMPINVFAADDEIALVIECKSTQAPIASLLRKEIEDIQGARAEIIRDLKNSLPDRKVKFVLATNNFVVSESTSDRLRSADIVHMDEDTIDYYLELAEHLGKAARFQLLGSLFAGAKIPGLEPRVAAIRGKMGGYTYYSFAIEPVRLLKMGYILHRNKANSELMPTYQRLIRRSRLKKVAQFVDGGGFFPNSIIVNIESGTRGLRFDLAAAAGTEVKVGVLHLPQTYRAAYIIDGQHRLYGYADSHRAETDLIPVVAFVGLPRAKQVQLFMQINENQQAVPKNLRNTLNADLLYESSDMREQVRALRLRIAQRLEEHKLSPLRGRIIIGEEKATTLRCVTIDSINTGLDRGNFIGSPSRFAIKDPGTFYRGGNEATLRALVPFLELSFGYMRDNLALQWELGKAEGGFVFANNGVESFLRVLSDIVDHLVAMERVDPQTDDPTIVFEEVKVYLEPLVSFLGALNYNDATEFKRLYGSSGRARYWRKLQVAINTAIPEFNPPGLVEYVTDESKAFNTESFKMIRDIETFLKGDIRRRLQDRFGSRWFKDGVPLKVYEDASALAVAKNRERDAADEVEAWDCLHLIDYQQILQKDSKIWQEIFEQQYTRPGDEARKGGWRAKSSWLTELNRIRNENAHSYSVKESEYNFLVAIHSWLGLGGTVTTPEE